MNSVGPAGGVKRWRRWLIGGVALMLVACLAVVGYGLWQLSQFQLGTTVEDKLSREDIERLIPAKLPASASNLHSYYSGFQDYYALVRFELSPADVPRFLVSSAYTATLSTTGNPFKPAEFDRPWWRPYEAQRFQWGHITTGSEYGTLLIDMTDPERYIVYWREFGT